jgi:hypothetical protein
MALDIVVGLTATQEGINRLKPAADGLLARLFRLVPDRALSEQVCFAAAQRTVLAPDRRHLRTRPRAAARRRARMAVGDPLSCMRACAPACTPPPTLCPSMQPNHPPQALSGLVNLSQDDELRSKLVKIRAVSRIMEAIREKSCPHLRLLVGFVLFALTADFWWLGSGQRCSGGSGIGDGLVFKP